MAMRLFKARFTTKFGAPIFSAVSEILTESNIVGVSIEFSGGGWDGKDLTICYHEWLSDDDIDLIKNFLESQYKESFIDLTIKEIKVENQGIA
jgi:hypothetical protein